MRTTAAVIAAVFASACASAQQRSSSISPIEAQRLSQVWGEIREAEDFADIDWRAIGLAESPIDAADERLMAQHWDDLRVAERFDDIDWETTVGFDPVADRYEADDERFAARGGGAGPFSEQAAETLREVWPEIRQADEYGDIDWQQVGVYFEPGDLYARRLMAENWEQLRDAEDFEDIDWEQVSGYRAAGRFGDAGAFGNDESYGSPFSPREAEVMSEVWPRIREAAEYEDIDWQVLGLDDAPGGWYASELMAENWDALRESEEFRNIDWQSAVDEDWEVALRDE